jgi:hypothetical protein
MSGIKNFENETKEVMTRQTLNFENVRLYAKKDKIDWLLHIDGDELFFNEDNDLQKIFINTYDYISFKNYEMIPTKDNYANCFKEGNNFKTKGHIFNAYGNGKSAVKVNSDAVVSGVHAFRNGHGLESKIGKILHYPSCNFDEYVSKYKILGKFSDKWWDSVEIPFKFHKESRDAITNCFSKNNTDECIPKIRDYYNKTNVLNDTYNVTDLKQIDFVRNQLN